MDREPRIVEAASRKLIGMSREMSRRDDQTAELWRSFMPRRGEVGNRSSPHYLSVQIFPNGPRQLADPLARFTKWAAVEVGDLARVPVGMGSYQIQSGTYAVFEHTGPASDVSTFEYIFTEWLPNSRSHELDDREHFEILPPDYDPRDPNAREEIWIPVKPRSRFPPAGQVNEAGR